MTGSNAPDRPAGEGDQDTLPVRYGHGRMPGFMKVAWVLFTAFIVWYVVVYLIPAAGGELAK